MRLQPSLPDKPDAKREEQPNHLLDHSLQSLPFRLSAPTCIPPIPPYVFLVNASKPCPVPLMDLLQVDDDPNDLALFGMAIDRSGLNIWLHTVHSAQEAIAYLEGRGLYADRSLHPVPKALVLDLKLPVMDGFEFLAWRLAHRALATLPIIAFTGLADKATVEKAMSLGVNKFILKPQSFEDWKEVVREVWDFTVQFETSQAAAKSPV